MKKHVIYFDIDGTIIDSKKHSIPDSTKKAVDMLIKKGYQLCIATGRRFESIDKEVMDLYLWDGYVCDNGHDILDKKKKLIYEQYFDKETIQKIIDISNQTGVSVELKTFNDYFLVTQKNKAVEKAYKYFNIREPKVKRNISYDNIIAIMLFGEEKSSYDEFSLIDEIKIHPGVHCYADVTMKGYNKGKGIKKSLEALNKKKYIAIGDSMNDYDMLKQADVSIAMGNGENKLKETADYVTRNVDDDGILYAAKWIIDQEFD